MRVSRQNSVKLVNAWFGEQPTYILFNAPADLEDWDNLDWKTYFELLEQKFGLNTAQIVWQKDFNKVVDDLNSNAQWLRYDCSVYNFLKSKGIDIGNVASKAYCVGSKAVTVAENTASTVIDATGNTVSSVADTVSNLGHNAKAVVGFLTSPIVLLGGGGFLVYHFWGDKLGLKKKRKN